VTDASVGLRGPLGTAVVPIALLLVLRATGPLAARMVERRSGGAPAPWWVGATLPWANGAAAVGVVAAAWFGRLPSALVPVALAIVMVVGTASVVDLATRRIPVELTSGGGALVLVLAAHAAARSSEVALRDVVLGAVVVPITLEVLARATWLFVGVRGVGAGDVRLAIPIGGAVGGVDPAALGVLAVTSALAALPAALRAHRRLGPGASFALAPALAFGTIVALLGGRPLAHSLTAHLGGA
jgi:leader peptidase (prepilin peptidase)/N-methyltransferase